MMVDFESHGKIIIIILCKENVQSFWLRFRVLTLIDFEIHKTQAIKKKLNLVWLIIMIHECYPLSIAFGNWIRHNSKMRASSHMLFIALYFFDFIIHKLSKSSYCWSRSGRIIVGIIWWWNALKYVYICIRS